ncbi:MAG: nucleotidyltransferase family protein [Thermoguttaceae bacterium]
MICVSGEEMKIVIGVLEKHLKTGEVRAFGSRYKGTNRNYSDLDIAIVGDERLADHTLDSIKEDFSDSELVFRVDVLDYHQLADNFRKIVDSGYEVMCRLR